MVKVSVAIKTADRTPHQNFLGETLRNMARVGVFSSPHLGSLFIEDSGTGDPARFYAEWRKELHDSGVLLPRRTFWSTEKRTLQQNASHTIQVAATVTDCKWVLVLEDDLDFVDDFLRGAVAWLEHHERLGADMYAFGANYRQVEDCVARGQAAWKYPARAFYGAQALAWRREVAAELAAWLGPDPHYNGVRNHGHDLLLQRWGLMRGTASYFLASAPSFVQHIGRDSGIGNRFFRFESWPGRGWRYLDQADFDEAPAHEEKVL